MWRNSLYLGEIKMKNQALYYLKQAITPYFTTQDAYNEQKLHPKKLQKNEKQTLHQQQGNKEKRRSSNNIKQKDKQNIFNILYTYYLQQHNKIKYRREVRAGKRVFEIFAKKDV